MTRFFSGCTSRLDEQHLDAGEEQEGAEEVEHPVEPRDERGARRRSSRRA